MSNAVRHFGSLASGQAAEHSRIPGRLPGELLGNVNEIVILKSRVEERT